MPIFTTEARTLRFVPSHKTTQTLSYRCMEFNCGSRRQVHQGNATESRHRALSQHPLMDCVHTDVSLDLVHVPSTHHGPDGLSRRRPQLGNEKEPEDNFKDWIAASSI